MHAAPLRFSLVLLLTLPILACASASNDSPTQAAMTCEGLTGARLADTTITGSKMVPAGEKADQNVLPAYCKVTGIIEERVGVGPGDKPHPYGTKFELRLPVNWNGRFFFQGGGGTDGRIRTPVGIWGPMAGQTPALIAGYAVVATDAGHEGPDAAFGIDQKARVDWGFHSLDIVARTAKSLISTYYGRKPDYSYFLGCSNGGRQAMMVAQRFPSYFDGVVAGNPGFRLPRSSIAEPWVQQAFSAVAPTDASGKPILSKAFSDADMSLLSKDVLAVCDANDGVKDGLISNPQACKYDPARLQCTGAKTDACLSDKQVTAIKKAFAGPVNAAGEQLYSDFPYDSGLDTPGWRIWRLGTSPTSVPNTIPARYSAVGQLFMTPYRSDLDYLKFDFDKDAPLTTISNAYMSADSTDLTGFKGKGAKMILYHGMSDPIFSANDTIRYYERLTAANGGPDATRSFARLYLLPGMNHCAGGRGLDTIDALSALVNWIEKGEAPDQILATGGSFPGRIRQLCPYPAWPHYKGTGSIDKPESFECR